MGAVTKPGELFCPLLSSMSCCRRDRMEQEHQQVKSCKNYFWSLLWWKRQGNNPLCHCHALSIVPILQVTKIWPFLYKATSKEIPPSLSQNWVLLFQIKTHICLIPHSQSSNISIYELVLVRGQRHSNCIFILPLKQNDL